MSTAHAPILTSAGLLSHWQGHRRLTRRTIEAYPADQLNSFSIGGMRTMGALVQEMLAMPIDALWPRIRSEAWQETMDAFGYFTGPAIDILLYVIDNEVHHRGQAYVYLRSLGIAPPAFHERP